MLPVKLPENIKFKCKRKSFEISQKDWKEIIIDGKKIIRETDTLRYICLFILVFFKILFTKKKRLWI